MAFLVRKQISWQQKKKIVVVYNNFNYYFFKDQTAKWIKDILTGRENNKIPADFFAYLLELNIIYENS